MGDDAPRTDTGAREGEETLGDDGWEAWLPGAEATALCGDGGAD